MTGGQYMNKTLEAIISKTTADLTCSPEEKLDIQHELRDHLYSAFENYLNEGYSKEDAIKRVLADFGHTETVSIQYQQVVNPLFGWLRKLAWIGFILYACVILWKVLISRIIIRVFITPGFIFGSKGERYIRISLCAKDEKIQEALERIKTTFEN